MCLPFRCFKAGFSADFEVSWGSSGAVEPANLGAIVDSHVSFFGEVESPYHDADFWWEAGEAGELWRVERYSHLGNFRNCNELG